MLRKTVTSGILGIASKGGRGSGNRNHAGRKGKVGGSSPSNSDSQSTVPTEDKSSFPAVDYSKLDETVYNNYNGRIDRGIARRGNLVKLWDGTMDKGIANQLAMTSGYSSLKDSATTELKKQVERIANLGVEVSVPYSYMASTGQARTDFHIGAKTIADSLEEIVTKFPFVKDIIEDSGLMLSMREPYSAKNANFLPQSGIIEIKNNEGESIDHEILHLVQWAVLANPTIDNEQISSIIQSDGIGRDIIDHWHDSNIKTSTESNLDSWSPDKGTASYWKNYFSSNHEIQARAFDAYLNGASKEKIGVANGIYTDQKVVDAIKPMVEKMMSEFEKKYNSLKKSVMKILTSFRIQ